MAVPQLRRQLGHYRLLERIGGGGMGEVFLARDEHLGRDVAVKLLPPRTLADESARRRFRKEATALSKISHPNVAIVFDFDTQDDVDFLVMEFIPGRTLSEMLATGPLPEGEVVRLGIQLADGLAAAHGEGVVHRDLKPGNIRVTPDQHLKILDFGLAKLRQQVVESEATLSQTDTQSVSGTLPYMSPEQLRGAPAEPRNDIYAAGVVLFEIATGKLPFHDKLTTALTDSILHRPCPPPGRLNPDLSPRLEQIILKCLEKRPEDRYQSAQELLIDLRRLRASAGEVVASAPAARGRRRWWWRSGFAVAALVVVAGGVYFAQRQTPERASPVPDKLLLAVLPFDNLSGDPEQEFFSDGLTEEMLTQIGTLNPARLGVIARTSVMRYKHTDKGIDQIGRELGVDYVLEGSVRRDKGRVRITAQLIQVRDQTHLWAEHYDRDLAEVFRVQTEVAHRVAGSLAMQLLASPGAGAGRAPTASPEAHEAYLRGRYLWNQRTEASLNKALAAFMQAIAKDPDYALAYTGLADTLAVLGNNRYIASVHAYPRARAAAKKALELDDNLAEAHTSLANVLADYDWDWAGAEKEFRRAIELNPGYATAHDFFAFIVLSRMGRHDEAIAEIHKARELDPLSPVINRHVGLILYRAGRYGEAFTELRRALELNPDDGWTHSYLGHVCLMKPEYGNAAAEYERAINLLPPASQAIAGLALAKVAAGRAADARPLLTRLLRLDQQRGASAADIAQVYFGLGHKAEGFRWLETAYQRRDSNLFILVSYPYWASLRSEPRFQDLLRRINWPQ